MLFYSINMHGISPLWSDTFLCIKYGEKLHRNQWKYFLSCLLVYFSVFHININQQIGCLNNANHIHFTCTLYCAPELSIITNILRKKWNLKSTNELFCYLKTMWLFLDKQQCCSRACFRCGFCKGFHSDVTVWSFGKGRGWVDKEGKFQKVIAHEMVKNTFTHKLENVRNINVLLLCSP